MAKRIKTANVLGRIVFLVLVILSLAVFYFSRSGNGWTDFALNCAFDVAAVIALAVFFEGCARPLAGLSSALDRATKKILNEPNDADVRELWKKYAEFSFENEALDARYHLFVAEQRRRLRINPLTADARPEDYIDESLIYSAVRKHYADQVSGIMTGLGILFTFIGLVFGLRAFDAGSVATMQTSTQELIAGIKVAFLTSIFGLIYSLIFTLLYRRIVNAAGKSLYNFLDAYTRRVSPSNEQSGENYLIRLQTEENRSLKELADNIGAQLTESFSGIVGSMQDTLRQYVSVAIEDQRAGLDRVVRYFLAGMNESMGAVFSQLKDRTEELAVWEKNLTTATQSVIETLNQTALDMGKTRGYTQSIIESISAFMERTDAISAEQLKALSQLNGYVAGYEKFQGEEQAALQGLVDAQQRCAQTAAAALESAEAIRAMSAAYTQAVDQKAGALFRELSSRVELLGKDVKANSDNSARRLEEANRQIAESAEALRSMAARITDGLEQAASRLELAASHLDGRMTEISEGSFGRFNTALSKLSTCVSEMTLEVQNASAAITESAGALPGSMESLQGGVRAASEAVTTELNGLRDSIARLREAAES